MACRLFTTYYRDQRDERQLELDICLQVNDSAFDRVFVVSEADDFDFTWSRNAAAITGPRPIFSYLLIAARTEAGPNDVVVIANTDILIPRCELAKIARNLQPNQAYCLNRWDITAQGIKLWDVEYGQDTWVFRSPPKENIGGDYWFGVPGVDNRFAAELDAAGYELLNPSRDIKTYHLHASNKRTATNTEAHRVPPPYLYIKPHRLGETPEIKRAATFEQRRKVIAGRRRA